MMVPEMSTECTHTLLVLWDGFVFVIRYTFELYIHRIAARAVATDVENGEGY